MNRIRKSLLLLLSAATLVTAAENPNVLFVLADDQSYETVRAFGHTDIDTPNLDRLAEAGTTFNLIATCAEILGAKLPDEAGVDSFSILPVLRGGETKEPTHPFVIHHSISGRFAIRKRDWKFIATKGSGGWSPGDNGESSQLYNMASDRMEQDNLVEEKAGHCRGPNLLWEFGEHPSR